MVYIDMTKDEKSQGKAAVDLVGSQIGKSGASWIAQVILSPPQRTSAASKPPDSLGPATPRGDG
eukprot:6156742-Pyramimonas_sp.AAC.1